MQRRTHKHRQNAETKGTTTASKRRQHATSSKRERERESGMAALTRGLAVLRGAEVAAVVPQDGLIDLQSRREKQRGEEEEEETETETAEEKRKKKKREK